MDKIRSPVSGLGTGWRSLMACKAPLVFHAMPEAFRLMVVARHLGPAPGWTVREQMEKLPSYLGSRIRRAWVERNCAHLSLQTADGQTRDVSADCVIAATGYRVDVRRLTFLSEPTQAKLRCTQHAPVLSRHFESSVPSLYFVGTAAANSFGPMLRFAYGARFTSRRLSRHLVRSLGRERSGIRLPHFPAGAPAGYAERLGAR